MEKIRRFITIFMVILIMVAYSFIDFSHATIKVEKYQNSNEVDIAIDENHEDIVEIEEPIIEVVKTKNIDEEPSQKVEKTTPKEESKTKENVKKTPETTKEQPKKTELEIVKENKSKLGTYGRLYIPSQNYHVALYNANAHDNSKEYNAQAIVDKKDSAAYFAFGNHNVIADHNYQGFKILVNVNKDTKAYIKEADGTITILKLKAKFTGKNLGSDLVDENGNSVLNMEKSLIMYTCYKDGIMITMWDKVEA